MFPLAPVAILPLSTSAKGLLCHLSSQEAVDSPSQAEQVQLSQFILMYQVLQAPTTFMALHQTPSSYWGA